MKKLFLSFAAVIVLSLSLNAQIEPPDTLWTRTFGGSHYDIAKSVQMTRDDGFIIAGTTDSYGAGSYDFYLIKTDAYGNQQWQRTLGGGRYDYSYSVQQTSDDGYIITGTTSSYSAGSYDVLLIKTDASGNWQWQHSFGGREGEYGRSVQQTMDGGYIIVGGASSYGAGGTDVYLIKTDSLGNQQWYRTFGGNDQDHGYSVQQCSDDGYIIAGETYSFGAGENDVYLIKTDSLGNQQWYQTFGWGSYERGWSVQQINDDGYIIAGQTSYVGAGGHDVYLIKTDASGNREWDRTYGGRTDDEGVSVQQTADDGYIIAGETISYGAGGNDVYIIKTDISGVLQWSKTIGGNSNDEGASVQQTRDGGYIIAGLTESYGAGEEDVYLIRLETEIPLTLILMPFSAHIPIPAGGGSFGFHAQINNPSNSAFTFDTWSEVILPHGITYGPLILRENLQIQGRQTFIYIGINQYVPGNAPPGIYTYFGKAGIYPDLVSAYDCFTFAKCTGDSPPAHNLGWACYGWDDGEGEILIHSSQFTILSSSPNPFNTTANISFQLSTASCIKLAVYDISGREASKLAEGWYPAGIHRAAFDGNGLSSGVYFARLQAGGICLVKKMLLLK